MDFIYSRNEIWNIYPIANKIVLFYFFILSGLTYISHFMNLFYFYILNKTSDCAGETILMWDIYCVVFMIMFCITPGSLVNRITLFPTRVYNIKLYFINFTIAYIVSYINIYTTNCYLLENKQTNFSNLCEDIQICKDVYSIFIISTNLYFLWMNSILVHILLTWMFHNIQQQDILKNIRVINFQPVRHFSNDQEIECVICFEVMHNSEESRQVIKTPCNHYFHNNCISEWIQINNTCPVCRINFSEMQPPVTFLQTIDVV